LITAYMIMPLTHTSEESRIIRILLCKANHNLGLFPKIHGALFKLQLSHLLPPHIHLDLSSESRL